MFIILHSNFVINDIKFLKSAGSRYICKITIKTSVLIFWVKNMQQGDQIKILHLCTNTAMWTTWVLTACLTCPPFWSLYCTALIALQLSLSSASELPYCMVTQREEIGVELTQSQRLKSQTKIHYAATYISSRIVSQKMPMEPRRGSGRCQSRWPVSETGLDEGSMREIRIQSER